MITYIFFFWFKVLSRLVVQYIFFSLLFVHAYTIPCQYYSGCLLQCAKLFALHEIRNGIVNDAEDFFCRFFFPPISPLLHYSQNMNWIDTLESMQEIHHFGDHQHVVKNCPLHQYLVNPTEKKRFFFSLATTICQWVIHTSTSTRIKTKKMNVSI